MISETRSQMVYRLYRRFIEWLYSLCRLDESVNLLYFVLSVCSPISHYLLQVHSRGVDFCEWALQLMGNNGGRVATKAP